MHVLHVQQGQFTYSQGSSAAAAEVAAAYGCLPKAMCHCSRMPYSSRLMQLTVKLAVAVIEAHRNHKLAIDTTS